MQEMYEKNTEIELPKNDEIKEGYRFLEYNTKQDGSGISYFPLQKIIITEDLSLFRIWEKIPQIPAGTYLLSTLKQILSCFIFEKREISKKFKIKTLDDNIEIPESSIITKNSIIHNNFIIFDFCKDVEFITISDIYLN